MAKNCLPTQETQETLNLSKVQSLDREDLLEGDMATLPVFLPGESHRQRNLTSFSPQGHS